jgi:hypothetical protein
MAWCEGFPQLSCGRFYLQLLQASKTHAAAPPIRLSRLVSALRRNRVSDITLYGHVADNSQGERRIGAITAIKARAPVLGGNFGVWGGLFSTFDCAVKGVRQKEDPWNASMFTPPPHPSCYVVACEVACD